MPHAGSKVTENKCVFDESSVQRQQSVLCPLPVCAGETGQMTCEHSSIIQLKGSYRSSKSPQLETKTTFIPQNQVLRNSDFREKPSIRRCTTNTRRRGEGRTSF